MAASPGALLYPPVAVEALARIGHWISENEALLSGIAAMIVVAGVVFTPFGAGLRRLLGARGDGTPQAAAQPQAVEAPTIESPVPDPEPPSSSSAAPSDRPSIAVLPFVNMSDDTEQNFLADGMSEDIITGLAATRHLYVVSRNSTFAYKGQSPDIRDVGRTLGVRYVLEGSVRRVGEKLRTTAQLIDATNGNHLWAEKYDRPYSEMFEVQDQVVGDIAAALSLEISSAEVARTRREPPSKLGAWELVTRGMWANFRETPCIDSSREALALLKAAVELDPTYTYARAAYAWLLFSSAINGLTEEPRDLLREGELQLKAALELDTSDPLTQYYVGAAYIYTGRHERALRFLELSLAGNPHQPDVIAHLALGWAYLGEFARAYELFDQADRLVPGHATNASYYSWYRGIALCLEERFADAIPVITGFLEHTPRYGTARITLGIALEGLGDSERAQVEIVRAVELDPGLNLEGMCLYALAHPDAQKGLEREKLLRRYWPSS